MYVITRTDTSTQDPSTTAVLPKSSQNQKINIPDLGLSLGYATTFLLKYNKDLLKKN